MLAFFGGSFLGWSLGANDAANVFGTAVSSRMIAWRHAALMCCIFVVLGASLQGTNGIQTLQGMSADGVAGSAGIAALCAALTVTLMTLLKLPVSTSQAVVGALTGMGLAMGDVNGRGLEKVLLCWIGTPIGAMVLSFVFYWVIKRLLAMARFSLFAMDHVMRWGLVICGCYGAYALGANNVANVASFFVQNHGMSVRGAAILGGVCIAVGVATLSRGVMATVGKGITPLDSYSALIVVLAQAVTVHIYALVGVPVSTSQAIIGAVLGISLWKGTQIINFPMLFKVASGWIATPILAGAVAWAVVSLTRLSAS